AEEKEEPPAGDPADAGLVDASGGAPVPPLVRPPLEELLATADDSKLCDRMFRLILKQYGNDIDAAELSEKECVVLLAYHAMGIIGNGGFNYLFEGNFPGDPHFALTAAAYQAIGCAAAAKAFRQALGLFPGGRPPEDINERLRIYRAGDGA